jgi:hypothetical protein
MKTSGFKTVLFGLLVTGLLLMASVQRGYAVPSFERQTGMSCTTCHTVFPELTPFGRVFKLGGYVFSQYSDTKGYSPPLAAMIQLSYTYTKDVLKNRIAPFDDAEDSAVARTNLPQQASVFYGGRMVDDLGAFIQVTYDGVGNDLVLDLTDIRWAKHLSMAGKNLICGLTVNNAPTVEDVWNSTPIWGFPYAGSAVAPGPAAGTVIDGTLASQVGGIGLYGYWADWIYAEASVYRTTHQGITRPFGAGTDPDTITDGAVPYWRAALQHVWGQHSAELGTYGLWAEIYPEGEDDGPTNDFRDTAVDAQYQFIGKRHLCSLQATWIHEKQDWDTSFDQGDAANQSDDLDTVKINASYYYRSDVGDIGGSVGYFSTSGDKDMLLYAPDRVDGSQNGKPDTKGFIIEADYLFREKYKLALQYTIYDEFNGSSHDYDGFGRDASDNNTFYGLIWFMF